MNKMLIISKIDNDGLETEVTYGEAVELVGKESVDNAIESAEAGCNSAIEVEDDSDIASIAFKIRNEE